MQKKPPLSQFNKLQEKWNQKLKDSGFEDIETGHDIDSGKCLKAWHSKYFLARHTPRAFNEKKRFYELATQLFEDHMFLFCNSTERQAWELFAEGKSCKEILGLLRQRGVKTNLEYINKIILELKSILITLNS